MPKKTAARTERSKKTGEEQAEDRIGTDRASIEDRLESKGDEDVALFGGGRME